MALALVLVLTIGFLAFPTMLAARVVGAGNTGFVLSLVATCVAVACSYILASLVPGKLLSSVVELAACAVVFKLLLRATLIQGAVVAVLMLAVQAGLLLGLASVGYALQRHA